jgi:PPOX class probable F420-dependent enzyme
MAIPEQELEEFLRQPNIAVIATASKSGRPHAVPIWYSYEDGVVYMHADESSRKYRDLRENPRVAVTVDTKTAPYKCAVLYGEVEMEVREDAERTKRMAIKYLGERIGTRYAEQAAGETVVISLKPSRIVSWDYGRGDRP